MGYRLLNGMLTPSVQCQPLRADESPELVYIRVRDHHLAFDPNSLALVELDTVEDYKKLRDDPPSPHIMARYKPMFKKGNVQGVKSLVIEATHDCNLACSYCFVRAYYEDHGTGNFTTFPVAKAAIDRLLNPREKLSVGFFGGEPLLNMKLIRQVVEYVRELSKRGPGCKNCAGKGKLSNGLVCKVCRGTAHQAPSFHVTTNGTLYSHENLKYLDENGFSLITSIDGDEDSHDALRPMKRSGTGSYANIMKGMERLRNYDISKRNTLRSTFTALMTTTITERLEHLNQICDDGGANWVSVEPAALSENSCFTPNQAEIEIHVGNVWDLFYDQYMDAADWWMQRALNDKTPRWHNVHKTLERIFWTVSAGSECFSGDTKVSLLDGTEQTMEDLVGTEQWFYSNHEGRVIPTKGIVKKTGTARRLLEVELDNGEKVKVTPDHEWQLRCGGYKKTEDLSSGDSLMPLYRRVGEGRWSDYELLYDPGAETWEFTHRRVCESVTRSAVLTDELGLEFVSRIVEHGTRHHLDFDARNNTPDNLVWMDFLDHRAYHSVRQQEVGTRVMNELWQTPWFQELRSRVARETMQAQLDDPDSKMNEYLSGQHIENNRQKYLDQVDDPDSAWNLWLRSDECNLQRADRFREAARTIVECPKCGQVCANHGGLSRHMIAKHLPKDDPRYIEFVSLQQSKAKRPRPGRKKLNHKVVAVRELPGLHDVYCVSVDHECHNFALSAGVFVHNCGAGVGYMSVNSKGELFGCHREANSYIGHIVSGVDQKLQQPWSDNRIYTRRGCMTCRQRYACGGGCREDSVGDHGDIHSPSNVHCNLKSMWVESAMKIMCELPKAVISKYCRNPAKGRSGESAKWLHSDQLSTDENGIVRPSWVGNIPAIALVKDGLADYGVPVQLQDAPQDIESLYDQHANPADPEGMLPAVTMK